MDQAFLENDIYIYLKKKNSSTLVSIIEDTYKHCEYILGMIPNEFSNYTIHDIHHAIRVINYMTEFVKQNLQEYSDFHLALIILSGLLHDTGMFVSKEEKKDILAKYIHGKETDNKQDLFQDYIRERHSKRAKLILDTYVVDKKSKSVLSSLYRLDSYNFSDEIALICQSHTESIEWIKENIKTSEILTDYEYNPQQIAFLLKLGDNLDIDARRAPYSLLNLLKIKGYSETEWEKHSPITNYDKIKYENNCFQIFFHGKSDVAFIYRKTMEHILWLENTSNEISAITSAYKAPYKFSLNKSIKTNIETVGFEATDLHFSLDYSSVLKLLMGEQIYGDRKYGLRELLQNSIDAVLVMKEKLSNKPTSNYQPAIWIEMNKDKNTISICDNGTGMTTRILEKYFFNIGKSYYSSGEYRNLNLNYSTIGHFGIGFLACFMLSSSVLLETQAIGSKPIVIEFESMSPFVTKIKNTTCIFEEGHGTRIHLSYDEMIPDIFSSEENLTRYVNELLVVENYKIRILSSENKITEIQNSTQKYNRHIHTEQFDFYYTFSGKLLFMDNPLPMWERYDDVFLFCDKNMLGVEEAPTMVVNLKEVYEVLNQIELNKSIELLSTNNDLKSNLGNKVDPSTQLFLLYMLTRCRRKEDLKKHIGEFIYNFAFSRQRIEYCSLVYWNRDSQSSSKRTLALIGYSYQHHDRLLDTSLRVSRRRYSESDIIDIFPLFPSYMKSISFSDVIRSHERVIKADDDNVYISTEAHSFLPEGRIYKNGIRVSDTGLSISPAPTTIAYGNLDAIVNVNSDEYELTVSRNSFISGASYKLNNAVTKEFYNDIINDKERHLSDSEKNLLVKIIMSLGSSY